MWCTGYQPPRRRRRRSGSNPSSKEEWGEEWGWELWRGGSLVQIHLHLHLANDPVAPMWDVLMSDLDCERPPRASTNTGL